MAPLIIWLGLFLLGALSLVGAILWTVVVEATIVTAFVAAGAVAHDAAATPLSYSGHTFQMR